MCGGRVVEDLKEVELHFVAPQRLELVNIIYTGVSHLFEHIVLEIGAKMEKIHRRWAGIKPTKGWNVRTDTCKY
jgi:hypothetical protein